MSAPDQSSSALDRPVPNGCSVRSSVERRLQRSGYTALSRVSCEFQKESGVLHLRGAVGSHYLKQVAQELVRDIEGVHSVDNQIRVTRRAPRAAARSRECPDAADSSPGT